LIEAGCACLTRCSFAANALAERRLTWARARRGGAAGRTLQTTNGMLLRALRCEECTLSLELYGRGEQRNDLVYSETSATTVTAWLDFELARLFFCQVRLTPVLTHKISSPSRVGGHRTHACGPAVLLRASAQTVR
jgi:hypothetical protein